MTVKSVLLYILKILGIILGIVVIYVVFGITDPLYPCFCQR
jgi:hypothetical protein